MNIGRGFEFRRLHLSYNSRMHEVDPDEEVAYSEDGVDLTLIRWLLTLTPAERLEVLQSNIRSVAMIRGAAKRC